MHNWVAGPQGRSLDDQCKSMWDIHGLGPKTIICFQNNVNILVCHDSCSYVSRQILWSSTFLIWYASCNKRGFRNLMFPLWFTLVSSSFVFLDVGLFNLFLVSPPFLGALVDLWLARFQRFFDFWVYWLWILRIALISARGLSCFKYPPTLFWMVGPMLTSSLGIMVHSHSMSNQC